MKNILTRDFLFLSIFAAITNFCIASPFQRLNDTTLLADNKAKSGVMVREANVEYPSLLEEHQAQSISYVQHYSTKQREYLIKTYHKGEEYFPKIVPIFAQYGLPEELKVLIALESDFKGSVVSRSGAVGYWQIMDEMALDYGLSIGKKSKNKKKKGGPDDRKNFYKSTVAAAKYLRNQYQQFNNDILLTVASYNCGSGSILRAIKKSGVATPTFWDIKKFLPAETRNYVMNFITLNVVFNNYDKFVNGDLLFASQMIPYSNPSAENLVN